jgi:hypothetical protein
MKPLFKNGSDPRVDESGPTDRNKELIPSRPKVHDWRVYTGEWNGTLSELLNPIRLNPDIALYALLPVLVVRAACTASAQPIQSASPRPLIPRS